MAKEKKKPEVKEKTEEKKWKPEVSEEKLHYVAEWQINKPR